MAAGIETRHARSCRQRQGGRCSCEPTYRVRLWDGVSQRRIVKPFGSYAAAQSWRRDALIALRRGREVELGGRRLRAVGEQWLSEARAGVIRTRAGDRYKPAAIRSYEATLRLRVYPKLGAEPLEDVRRADLQELVDELVASGLAESTIEATIIPVRSILRHELERDRLTINPTAGLKVPRASRRRERIADPVEAAALLAAVPAADRAPWATAMYAGLRRGELKALRVDRIDLEANVVHVEKGWDDREGEIETKGRNRRRVPIPAVLREHLLAHRLATGRRDRDLASAPRPPSHSTRST